MNKQLKELMLEAGYAAPELAGRGQKLAELLVKECADVVDTADDECHNWHYAKMIKQHFGVEE